MNISTIYDWSRFVKRIPIKASHNSIYDAWTTGAGLERWFLRKGEYKSSAGQILETHQQVSKGDSYEWYWHGYGDEAVERGKILEANGTDLFRFVFGVEGLVTVNILTENGETLVELFQENIPTDEASKVKYHLGCSIAWTYYLTNLKSILEGGIDLRNKNINLKNVINS